MSDLVTPREVIMRALSDPSARYQGVANGYGSMCKLIEQRLDEAGFEIKPKAIAALEAQPRLSEIAPEGHTRATAIRCYTSGLSPYGFCPKCFRVGTVRERRPNGNDQCAAGHTYPSRNALSPHQVPEAQPESVKPEGLANSLSDWRNADPQMPVTRHDLWDFARKLDEARK